MSVDLTPESEKESPDCNQRLLFYTVLCQMAMWTGAALFIPMIPLYLRYLKATDVEIGYYSAATMISLSLGPVVIGWLSDKIHVRDHLIVVCYLLQAPMAFGMSLTENLVVACLLNMGMWTFGASAMNLTRAIVALNFSKKDRDSAFAWIAITSPISFVVGGFLSGRVVEAYGYQGWFEIVAVCWLVAAVVALGIRDRYVPVKSALATEVALKGPIVLFCVAIGLQSFFMQWSEIGLPLRLKDLDFSLPFITSMYSISSLVSIPFVLLGGRYASRIGNLNLLIGGAVLLAGCRIALGLYEHEWQIIGLQIIVGVPIAFLQSVAVAVMAGLGPDRRVGSRMAFLMMSTGIGGAVGGLAGGHILATFGPAGLLICSGVGMAFVSVCMWFFVVESTDRDEAYANAG